MAANIFKVIYDDSLAVGQVVVTLINLGRTGSIQNHCKINLVLNSRLFLGIVHLYFLSRYA